MKELILLVKTNYKNSFLYLFLFGIFLIPFQKSIELIYPNFFFGKFQDLETINISFSNLFIIIGSTGYLLLKLLNNKIQLKISKENSIIILFFLYLSIVSFLQKNNLSFFIISGLLVYLLLINSNAKIRDKIYNTFLSSIFFQLTLSIFQIIFQKNTNLELLTYLGEPKIANETKGISKVRYENFEILRAYGTTLNPNFNSILFYLALLLTNTKLNKFLFFMGNITTLSITGISASIIYLSKLFKQSKKILITISIIFFTIIIIRIKDVKYESISERIDLFLLYINNYLTEFKLSNFLFGSNNYLLDNINYKTLPWDYLPVHNLFLLIFQIFGIIGLIFILVIIFKLYKYNKVETLVIFIIANLDHYFITNPAGLTIFAIIIYLITNPRNLDFQASKNKDPFQT